MKIYRNPWVKHECYFVRTGAKRPAKWEVPASNGYTVEFWDGKWTVSKEAYYDDTIAKMPVVGENRVSIQAVINKAILDAVLGLINAQKVYGGNE